MPNDYFQFKQFKIKQDKAAMKVTTDACLFGSWIANKWKAVSPELIPEVLDIGTGTGLLSLMLAQQVTTKIDAIEIDLAASLQAKENVTASPWKNNITVMHADAREYAFNKSYDLIISNPPFYENALRSPDVFVNHARHDTSLVFDELLLLVRRVLKKEGYFGILIPYHRYTDFNKAASDQELLAVNTALVKPTPRHDFTRAMILYRAGADNFRTANHEELVIKEVHHRYTDAFVHYLKDYYLSL